MTTEWISHLWQSTLFAVAAGLLTIAFRRNRAHVRYWLWFSASFKFLAPFALLIALGSHIQWAPAARNAATQVAAPAISFAMLQPGRHLSDALPLVPPTRSTPAWVLPAILGVWACGFSCILWIRFRGWLRIRAAVRASTPMDIPAAVAIRSSPGLLEPGVVGLLRPILLLPAGIAERLPPPQLEAVLAHELCHVRRRDNMFALIHMIVEAVFWFHPLVWWIGVKLVEERERACDEEVLILGSQPRVYAEGILNVCKLYLESPLVCVSGITGANLKRRIEAIMTNRVVLKLNLAKKFALTASKPPLAPGQEYCKVMVSATKPAVDARGSTLAEFCHLLDLVLDRPVIDKTGIPGKFDIRVEFASGAATPRFLPGGDLARFVESPDPAVPTIFAAVEQLGLKLEATQGTRDFLVIDHVERPASR